MDESFTELESSATRVRALAMVHVTLGLVVAATSGVVFWRAMGGSHGPNDLGALGAVLFPLIAAGVGALILGLGWLLWRLHPIGRGIVALAWTTAAITCVYLFFQYTIDFIQTEANRVQGERDYLRHHCCGGLIEILITSWAILVVVNLFVRGTGDVFLRANRRKIRADRSLRLAFARTRTFAIGLVIWTAIGVCAYLL